MEQGDVEQQIIRQCVASGIPLPEKIQNAPELQPGLELYYTAFLELSTCRPPGWSVSAIPWTAIAEYGKLNGFEGEQLDDLFTFTRAMDTAYLRHYNKKEKDKAKRKI